MTSKPPVQAEHPLRLWLALATLVAVMLTATVLVRGMAARSEAFRRRAALLSDLGRLADAQEEALARDGRYAAHLDRQGGTDTARFTPSANVQVRFELLGPESWQAVVTDSGLVVAPRNCGMFRGEASASPHRAVIRPGVPACW